MKPTDFAYLLSNFLSKYLTGQRNLSSNTVKAYRDSFMLLLLFLREARGISPERVTMKTVDPTTVNEFLLWLSQTRGNSASTQNQRLAAIHAFFKYAQGEAPEFLFHCQKILAIPFRRCPKPVVGYLSETALQQLLASPNTRTATGRRDLVLLSVLYDTGARVSELIDLTVRDVRLDEPMVIKLTGKGRKERYVPVMKQTTALLKNYMAEKNMLSHSHIDFPLFSNRQHQKLTRAGVAYILKNYGAKLATNTFENRISPHVMRHTKAMHLIQAGVNLVYIRDLLGRSEISTTEIYARADTEMKRAALEKIHSIAIPDEIPSWENDKGLMDWLSDFCR